MYNVTLRFYEELNDFLPPDRRKCPFNVAFPLPRSVKDLIESLGVPHVEVDLVLVNGTSVSFDYQVRDGDRISVYPVFERLNIGPVTKLRPVPLRSPAFVLDVHLRALARRLRMLGFDTDYAPDRDDPELADISNRQHRILLTRDRQLLMRSIVTHGLYIRATDPDVQIREVLDRLDAYDLIRPFARCINCNGRIHPVPEDDIQSIRDQVPNGVLEWCNEFRRCESCGQVYWKGGHYRKMMRRIRELQQRGNPPWVEARRGATGPDATGTDATGTDATGTDATGTDATGTDATGTDATGTDATGTGATN